MEALLGKLTIGTEPKAAAKAKAKAKATTGATPKGKTKAAAEATSTAQAKTLAEAALEGKAKATAVSTPKGKEKATAEAAPKGKAKGKATGKAPGKAKRKAEKDTAKRIGSGRDQYKARKFRLMEEADKLPADVKEFYASQKERLEGTGHCVQRFPFIQPLFFLFSQSWFIWPNSICANLD